MEHYIANQVSTAARNMQSPPGRDPSRYIAQCRGYGDVRGASGPPYPSLPSDYMYKLYFEYCEYGDLWDLVNTQEDGK